MARSLDDFGKGQYSKCDFFEDKFEGLNLVDCGTIGTSNRIHVAMAVRSDCMKEHMQIKEEWTGDINILYKMYSV